ncbi:hypothetical protein KQI84_02495 [bacterium]|nr:hypothetical protein [bacterium]
MLAEVAEKISQLGYMAGNWRAEFDGEVMEEFWAAPMGNSMSGVTRFIRDDKLRLMEVLSIEGTDRGIVMYIKHFAPQMRVLERQPLAYKLVRMEDGLAVFENRRREFPRTITYRREGDNLTATLEGKRDDAPAELVFRFKPI